MNTLKVIFSFVLIIAILCMSDYYMKSQISVNSLDKHFSNINFDTLHVHTEMDFAHSKLALSLSKQDAKETEFYPVSSFYIDKAEQYKAYLIKGSERNDISCKSIYIVVFQIDNDSLVFLDQIAGYCLLEGTYERIQNAWIADFTGNGELDIGIYSRLTDFEFPTENTDNISNDEIFLLIFKNNKFHKQLWNYDVLKHFNLLPH